MKRWLKVFLALAVVSAGVFTLAGYIAETGRTLQEPIISFSQASARETGVLVRNPNPTTLTFVLRDYTPPSLISRMNCLSILCVDIAPGDELGFSLPTPTNGPPWIAKYHWEPEETRFDALSDVIRLNLRSLKRDRTFAGVNVGISRAQAGTFSVPPVLTSSN